MNLTLHIGVLPALQNAARGYLEELQAHAAT